jgi:hypothetical protein
MVSIKEVARWIALLPVAIGAAWLGHLAATLGGFFGGGDDWFLGKLYLETASGMFMGAAFVFSGAKIAPKHNKRTAYALTVIAVLTAGFLLCPALQVLNYWAMWNGGMVAVGAAGVAYAVSEGETEFT